jgi:3-hydroxyacyl-CoA dehydrogenase-like protein
MATKEADKVYLPRMRTRIGKAGYKGKNVVQFDQASPPKAAATVVTAPAAKAPASKTAKIATAIGRRGLKPLKKS